MTGSVRPDREPLLRIVHAVRARWRWKVALGSATVLVGAAIATLLAASAGLEWFRFSPTAVVVFRVVTYVVLVAAGWLVFVRPLARRVSDQQVALYLEEHAPSLEQTLVSALAGAGPERTGQQEVSSALLRRLIEDAIARCEEVDRGRRIERRSLVLAAAAMAGIAVVAVAVYRFGPPYLRQGTAALLLPAIGAEAASPYRIDVEPGDATVARGSDVAVVARLSGFTAVDVDLYTRQRDDAPFERGSLVFDPDRAAFEGHLFALQDSTDYFVQAAGVRTAVFHLDVADLPRVDGLEMELVFPAYTGLPPKTVERGGDIAALRGTTVRLRVRSSMPTASGRIVTADGVARALAPIDETTLAGTIEVERDGLYRLELASPGGALVVASPDYVIDALEDAAPTVVLEKPARDLKPTNLEEVFVEVRAEDDYGLGRVELVYTVNGGSDRVVALVGPGASPAREAAAGHTFYLEELPLQPGDVVSYYARARDNDAVQGPKTSASDIFFLEIRPFRKDYRAAESQAMAGAQAGAASGAATDPSALSEQQRRIVTGTFNVVRDRAEAGAEKFREDVVFLALSQGQLRERVEALAAQMNVRLDPGEGGMRLVAQSLGDAAAAMRTSEQKLQAREPAQALAPEQQALRNLLRAEEAYRDVRVAMSNERGGGGQSGSRGSPAAEDLADLFQLEVEKLRNQYETFQRSQQQAADDRVDEMLERLKELARRQEQEAERQRQAAASRQAGGGGTGAARQRQLAEEAEEAARRLDRLSREDGRTDLADAAQQLREAADAMRRAASRGDAGAFAEAAAAAEALGAARDHLQQQRSDRLARAIAEARARVGRLAEEQARVEQDVRSLPAGGADRRTPVSRLLERKARQATEVAGLEQDLDRTAADFQRDRPEAARRIRESADTIRDRRLKEKIAYSRGLVQGAPPESAAGFEEQIGADIAAVGSRLAEAAAAAGTAERDRRAEALARARALVRGVETMDRRLREGTDDSAGGRGEASGGRRENAARGSQEARGAGRAGGTRGDDAARGGGGGTDGARGAGGAARAAGSPAGGNRPAAGGGGDSRPGAVGPDQARQLAREARERRGEAERLRRELQELGVGAASLDEVIRGLEALDNARVYADPDEALRLQTQVLEGMRQFEFDLRRALGEAAADQMFLTGADQAPAEYRRLIEEYYRSLARARKR